MPAGYIETPRLNLRDWTAQDRVRFANMNADPRVMQYFPARLSRKESDRFAAGIGEHLRMQGWGLFAVELKETCAFIGYVGLAKPSFEAHFTPCVEIGWRLAAEYWGRGYATEAARSVVDYAFTTLAMTELVSFTVPANLASRRVMEKIGMRYDCEFEHPRLPENHPLRTHVLYRLKP